MHDKTDWFKEAKLGLFIHWTAHAVAGARGLRTELWSRPFAEWKWQMDEFALDGWDTDEFVRRARDRGIRYIVPTSHHFDGFCLWDTQTTDFKVTNSPRKIDIIGELAAACRKYGLKFGVYFPYCDFSHPLMDKLAPIGKMDSAQWGNEMFLPANEFEEYRAHLQEQVRELCTNYGELAVMWWDAGPSDPEWTAKVRGMVSELQPAILQNSRWGMDFYEGERATELHGDFFSPEVVVPSIPLTVGGKPIPWETCLTTIQDWLYDYADHNYKSATTLVRTFVEDLSKGGNLMVNISPDADGRIPAELDAALDGLGNWIKANGEAVWGTTTGPRHDIPQVALVRKGRTLYANYFGNAQSLVLPGFGAEILSASFLTTGTSIPLTESERGIELDLTASPSDPHSTVIKLEFAGDPIYTGAAVTFPADALLRSGSIDGEPAESDWEHAPRFRVTGSDGHSLFVRQPSEEELSFTAAALNDDTNLYVRVDVVQSSLGNAPTIGEGQQDAFKEGAGAAENEKLRRSSSVEIYIDGLPPSQEVMADERCFQIVIASDGQDVVAFADEGQVPHSSRVARGDVGYTVYCTIPFTSIVKDLGRTSHEYLMSNFFALPRRDIAVSDRTEIVRPGDELGFNVSVNAPFKDGDGNIVQKLWWQTRCHNAFNDPHQWGRLRLAE